MNDSAKVDTLTERLNRLERQMRWWQCAALLAICSAGLMLLVAASPAPKLVDVIQAKRLEIVDDKGRTRIELGLLREPLHTFGEVGVTVKGESGKLAVALSAGGFSEVELATLSLHDRTGRSRIAI